MRTLLLLLLGGSLVWWLFRDTNGTVSASGASTSAGEMLPAEPDFDSRPAPDAQPVAPATEASNAAARVAETSPPNALDAKRASAEPEAAPIEPAAARAAATRAAEPPAADVRTRSVEARVAGQILHDPRNLGDALTGAGESLAASRQRLARTLAALVAGDEDEAAKLAQGLDTDASVTTSELEFVKRWLAHAELLPNSASASRPSPLLHAATLGLMLRTAEKQLETRQKPRSTCELLSQVMLEELSAEWATDAAALRRWAELLRRAQTDHRWRRDGDWPALELTVAKGDSLITVRKRALEQDPALVLCTGLIARANQLSRDLIHPGQVLRIPTQRVRMLVDLSAHWTYLLAGDEVVGAWEVGVGKPGQDTQPGTYYVGEKREEPMWFPPGEEPVPFGDARNPLGTRWIELRTPAGEVTHLGFHGTNDPASVGSDASLGCVRLRNADVEELYEILPRGSEVRIQP